MNLHVFPLLVLFIQIPTTPQTDTDRLAGLQLAAECRTAGDRFWTRGGFKSPGTYTTHYNRDLSKCLVKTVTVDKKDNGKTSLFAMIYDANEGAEIAFQYSEMVENKWRVLLTHGNDPKSPDTIEWFDGLMTR